MLGNVEVHTIVEMFRFLRCCGSRVGHGFRENVKVVEI
jgi:hypothetical protein